uniref:Uncharacterized protein n=1 Tax=viral metagenome TaxID=1070528 RepID=A0A6M3IUT2_9ZZZZ
MKEIIEDLQNLKKEVEAAKSDLAKTQGALKANLDRLKEEHNLSGLEEVDKLITNLLKELDVIKNEVEEEYTSIKESYEWGG